MKIIIMILLAPLLFSCSLLEKSEIHEQMSKELALEGHPLPLNELKEKVDLYLKDTSISFDGKLIILNSSNISMGEHQEKIREKIEDGFIYNDKLYEMTPEVGMDLLTLNFEGAKDKLFSAKYHLIKDDKNEFIFIKGDRVYIGTTKGKSKSQLEIFQITKVIVPLNINLDWLNILRGKGLALNISESPVDLAKSLKYKRKDRIQELSLYFKFNPSLAEKRENELLALKK